MNPTKLFCVGLIASAIGSAADNTTPSIDPKTIVVGSSAGDTPGEEPQPTPPKAPVAHISGPRITPAQLRYVERLIDETGSDLGKVLDYFGVTALTELSSHTASRAITSLEKQRRAA